MEENRLTLKQRFAFMVLDKDIAEWEAECEKISDKHAIEFAEWLINSSILKTEIPMNVKLKMYKNQKGL